MGTRVRLVAAGCGALFVPLALPMAIGRVLTGDDLAAMHLPFRFLYSRALSSGDSFLWMPAMRSGLFLYGEGEGGFAHPLHLLLYRFLPLGTAFNLEIIASYVLMLAGACLLLRRLGVSIDAALFGAMLFTFSGFNVFNLPHVNHIAAVAHLPWILLCAHMVLTSEDRAGRARGFAGLAVAVGSQMLVGNPQYVWLTALATAFMTACFLRGKAVVPRLALVAGAAVLGGLIGAVQLLPTLDFVQETVRRTWTLDQSLTFSLSPYNLVQMWAPFAFRFRVHAPPSEAQLVHEFIVYNGAVCTVALAWLALRWRSLTRRTLVIALAGFAAIAIVLAFGRYGGLYPSLARLPGLRDFRAPSRHVVLFQLALAGLAAIAFEDLSGLAARRETLALGSLWPLGIPAALSIVTTVLAVALARTEWAASRDMLLSGLTRAVPWSLVVIGMCVLFALAARSVRWALPAIVICTAFDLGLWGYSYLYRWGPMRTVGDLAASTEVPAAARAGDLIVPMGGGGPVDLALLRGFRMQTGYFGLETTSVLDPADPTTQRLAGVEWRPDGPRWTAVTDSMPRARLVAQARTSRDIRADVRVTDIAQAALVDADVPALSGQNGTAEITTDRPGRIVVNTSAGGRQLLVVSERFHSGWQVTEDGGPRAAIAVYGDYLGSVVDAGRHRVEFEFAPASVRTGLRTSIAGVVLTVIATAVLW